MKQLQEIQRLNPKINYIQWKNIKSLYNSREKVVKLYNDYAKVVSQAIYKAKQGTGLKILTPKQMLQRFPIALAQVKAGNNSEGLLNKIRQIV